MYKHLLVPLDGSPASEAALTQAIALAQTCGAALTVMMVYDPFPYIAAAAEYGSYQVQLAEDLRLEAEQTVQAASARAQAAGLQTSSHVVELQKVWRAVLDVAQTEKADLIVMGSHGRSGLDKLVMGSVTQRVLQHTHLPVLVVRD
jgi:nucleotide-binding universal stress UspA family protein